MASLAQNRRSSLSVGFSRLHSGISPVEEPRHPVSGCGYRKHSGQEGNNYGPPHWWAGVELRALTCVLHTNYLEMLALLLSLKHFLQWLKGYHVLVRTHNSIFVAYINRQGGLASSQLHRLHRDCSEQRASEVTEGLMCQAFCTAGQIFYPEATLCMQIGGFTPLW